MLLNPAPFDLLRCRGYYAAWYVLWYVSRTCLVQGGSGNGLKPQFFHPSQGMLAIFDHPQGNEVFKHL